MTWWAWLRLWMGHPPRAQPATWRGLLPPAGKALYVLLAVIAVAWLIVGIAAA